jgi:hypothetical protein
MTPKKLLILQTSKHLNVIFGSLHRRFDLDNEETSQEFAQTVTNLARQYKKNPSDALEQELTKYLDPSWRENIDDWLCRDAEGRVYLISMSSHPLPAGVVKMIEAYRQNGDDLTPLKNFWGLAQLNPNEEAREGLFDFIDQYGVPVTDNGYMILYKAVNNEDNQDELVRLVATAFVRIRQNQDIVDNYVVIETPGAEEPYMLVNIYDENIEYWPAPDQNSTAEVEMIAEDPQEDEALTVTRPVIGTLKELHHYYIVAPATEDKVPDKSVKFRPWYSGGTHGTDIALGKLVTMPRHECDPNINNECSYGLHVGSYEYVKRFAHVDQSILACLVSPMDIVALPRYDNSKIRTCAYFPYGMMERREDGTWDAIDENYWEEDFQKYEKQWLEEQIASLETAGDQGPDGHQLNSSQLEELAKYKERLVALD